MIYSVASVIAIGATVLAVSLPAMAGSSRNQQSDQGSNRTRGTAVAFPWSFEKGNETSRTMAVSTAEGIARKADYASVPGDVAARAWGSDGLMEPSYGQMPSNASLEKFGQSLHVSRVIFGQVTWNTRSIWVNAGPKTISTARVNAYVFDVKASKIIYRKKGVEGRSDEKTQGWKIAADVLVTPLVAAVSGGPATPHEQRAVQIALGKAFHDWVHPMGSRS
jgi:hypothetical protein